MLLEMVVYWLECEECGESSEQDYSIENAISVAEGAGWLVDNTSEPDYIASWCPEHRKEAENGQDGA